MEIVVVGTGYVGLVTAVCLADNGHNVTCIDIDESKIKKLREGISPIFEQDLEELMRKNKKKINYTTDFMSSYKDAEVIFIGVGTPEKKDGSANLSYVYAVAKQIAESVEHNCVVVVKSTVPVGTTEKVMKILNENKKSSVQISVVSNPEFLAQGTAVRDTLHASRIVIGVDNRDVEKVMRKVYKDYDAPMLVMDIKSAEMVKYASNDFLALKISYINEIANLCEIVGANVEDVAKGMGYDNRIGDKFLNAGIGYGGSCFPKDTKALHWLANMNDYDLKTVKAAIEVNEQQKLRLIKKSRKYYENFEGLTVAVLGLTFKPGTDDLREAASLINIPIILEDGANIRAFDPAGIENFKNAMKYEDVDGLDRIKYYNNIDDTIRDADICFIFTEWEEIKKYDIGKYSKLMKKPIIMDGRNCYTPSNADSHGIIYNGIGK
ncbi:UDP-glucose/GDP-mannose dehydrogenase family protein [Paenibacillus sp. FSL H8-0122]|uniref:UDP-glucose dehydrogenase family protein n=1 Tax=Paenibacillus sp. FSL H8-0122 TaxID=2954510 RepID=UPI0030FC83B8